MDIDENGETINLEHFERTTEHLSHPQTIHIDDWLIFETRLKIKQENQVCK